MTEPAALLVTLLLAGACTPWLIRPSRPVLLRPAVNPKDPVRGRRDPALLLDLIGAMLEGGTSLQRALTVVADHCDPVSAAELKTVTAAMDLGADWPGAWATALGANHGAGTRTVRDLHEALAFAGITGAPSARVLQAHSAQLRRRRNREAERRAAELGVKLVVPLGVCSLPAFVCLGVLPVLAALLPGFG